MPTGTLQAPPIQTQTLRSRKSYRRAQKLAPIVFLAPAIILLCVLFKNIFDPNFGPINAILTELGLYGLTQDWLGDPDFALGSIIAVVCWQNIPFYMVLFLAALSSFPREIVEAANLDGASQSTIFWRLKLPHMQGTFRTAVLLAVIGSMRYFDLVYVMTDGGPEHSSEMMATYMYHTVFNSFDMGYGSTIASGMFLIITVIAAISMRLSKRFETEI
nr:sugar ABC transporter permease [uncultured Cohaesibacter sp.]